MNGLSVPAFDAWQFLNDLIYYLILTLVGGALLHIIKITYKLIRSRISPTFHNFARYRRQNILVMYYKFLNSRDLMLIEQAESNYLVLFYYISYLFSSLMLMVEVVSLNILGFSILISAVISWNMYRLISNTWKSIYCRRFALLQARHTIRRRHQRLKHNRAKGCNIESK